MAKMLHRLTGTDGSKMEVYPDRIYFTGDGTTILIQRIESVDIKDGSIVFNDGVEYNYDFSESSAGLAVEIKSTIDALRRGRQNASYRYSKGVGIFTHTWAWVTIGLGLFFVALIIYIFIGMYLG